MPTKSKSWRITPFTICTTSEEWNSGAITARVRGGKKKRERKKEGEERMELWGNNYWGKRGGRERW